MLQTKSHLTPSVKSVVMSSTSSPHSLKLTFTQFLKVFAWIWIHSSSLPLMCMLLAACPSGDLAARPARSASDIRRSPVTVIFTVFFTRFRWRSQRGFMLFGWPGARCAAPPALTGSTLRLGGVGRLGTVVGRHCAAPSAHTGRLLPLAAGPSSGPAEHCLRPAAPVLVPALKPAAQILAIQLNNHLATFPWSRGGENHKILTLDLNQNIIQLMCFHEQVNCFPL